MSEDQPQYVEPLNKPDDPALLFTSMIAFLDVWNMDCSKCATWISNKLLPLNGVLTVDIFVEKGVAVVTYDPSRVTTDELLTGVAKAGDSVCHYYGAALIGNVPAGQTS